MIAKLKELQAAGYNINADHQALDNFVHLYRDDPERKSTLYRKAVKDNTGRDCTIGTDNLFICTAK